MSELPLIRALHVYRTYFPDPPGGLQEAIKQICLATSAFGVETKIFTLSPTPEPHSIKFLEGEVIRGRSWTAPASCDLGGLEAILQFRKLSAWADVIHFHFPWPFADILHLFSNSEKPAVMTYHSDIVRQRFLGSIYAPLMRKTLHSMSAVIATSPAYAKTSIVLKENVPPENLRTIPLGIVDYYDTKYSIASGLKLLERLGLNEVNPFILSLGVLRYYKGLHTLIAAANAIRGTIVIAGSGPEEQSLKSMTAELGVTNVVFAGQISQDEKVVLLQYCRALALPSNIRSEAFGMVLVEASMFSKPMVCCEVGSGTSFVNAHAETGFVIPPESPADLAAACNQLLDDVELASVMGRNARLRYEKLFSGDALGRAYFSLYQEVSNLDIGHSTQ